MSSSDSNFKDCIDLNTRAIACMREGRHIESTVALRMALEKLELCYYISTGLEHPYANNKPASTSATRALTPSSPPQQQQHHPIAPPPLNASVTPHMSQEWNSNNNNNNNNNNMEETVIADVRSRRPSFMSISIESAGINAEAVSLENIFLFFPRMFHVTLVDATSMGFAKVYMILLFNISVSRHVNAFFYLSHNRVNPHVHLMNILYLYEMVIQVARSSLHQNDQMEMLGILVATANNVGHIASHLLLFKETRVSIARVLQLLAISGEESFPKEDLQIFFWSICTFLEGDSLNIAPAA